MNEKSEINNNKNVDSRWPERDKNTGQEIPIHKEGIGYQHSKRKLTQNTTLNR